MTYTERVLIDVERKVGTGEWLHSEGDAVLAYLETDEGKKYIALNHTLRMRARHASTGLLARTKGSW